MPKRTNDGLRKRCGCARRIWPKCQHPWHFNFHHDGREYRVSLDAEARKRDLPCPRSKHDAATWRDRLRAEIRDGKYSPEAPTAPATPLTLDDICHGRYRDDFVRIPTRRQRGQKEMEVLLNLLCNAQVPAHGGTVRLGAKPITDITKADLEAVRAWRRSVQKAGTVRVGAKGGEVGINRLLSRARHLFNWCVAEGFLNDTPFKRGAVTVVKLNTKDVEHARTRRLHAGEEQALLKHADPHLRSLIVAALTTGCRVGELLSLQWQQIRRDADGQPRQIVLLAEKTKTAETRVIPVSTRLRAELEVLKHAPDGTEHPATAYVFGNAVGERVLDVRRQWEDCVLKANGHQPQRVRGKLSAASRAAYRAIDLHVHDLRREFASRLLESRADLHDVKAFLGHASITTTSRYLESTTTRMEGAIDRLDKVFAQDSHTKTEPASADTPIPASEIPVTH